MARRGKARQGKVLIELDKIELDNWIIIANRLIILKFEAWHGRARLGSAGLGEAGRGKARQGKARQGMI